MPPLRGLMNSGKWQLNRRVSSLLFISRKQTITNYTSDGDGAIIDIDYDGVLASGLPNGMKAGETLKLTGRSEFTFMEEKISSIKDYS